MKMDNQNVCEPLSLGYKCQEIINILNEKVKILLKIFKEKDPQIPTRK